MDTFEAIALVTATLALIAAAAYAAVVSWRRVMNDDRPLPFFRVLDREGIPVEALREASTSRIATAVRRCALCGGKDDCRAAFDAGRPQDAAADCPNADLFAALKRQ